jgi:hypothetical protein
MYTNKHVKQEPQIQKASQAESRKVKICKRLYHIIKLAFDLYYNNRVFKRSAPLEDHVRPLASLSSR